MAAAAPSPTADASCFVDPPRTSPATKSPGALVMNEPGSVTTNPASSRATVPFRNDVFGSSPMNTKTAAG